MSNDSNIDPLRASPHRFQNTFLDALPPADLQRIDPHLELVDLEKRQLLNTAGVVPEFIFFPEGGILSFTLPMPVSGHTEFGLIGREGLSSLSAMWTERASPVDVVLQIGDAKAYRTEARLLREAHRESEAIRTQFLETLYSFMSQMAYTAISNARHTLLQRLARWLLVCNDRLIGDEIALTHEFLSMMLGAQRTSVTATLHILEGEGAIYSRRGSIQLRDRSKLEQCAGEAYDSMGRH